MDTPCLLFPLRMCQNAPGFDTCIGSNFPSININSWPLATGHHLTTSPAFLVTTSSRPRLLPGTMANRLSIPAVRQILAKLAKGEREEDELVEKLEDSCLRYDHDKKGVQPL